MSLPVLHLDGAPYEQGLQHGKALKDRIETNLKVYFERFEREGRLSRAEALKRSVQYLEAIEAQNRDYFNGMQGIAAGSGFDLDQLAALNVRYELLYYQFGVNALADGCTAFAVMPSASAAGHLLLGQNWDWIPQVRGAVLQTVEADGLETVSFTEAGIVGGKIGLNSAGLGLAINGMTTTDDDWSRLSKPFHLRCYEILRARSFEEAVRVITDSGRACSANFLIAQAPDRALDIEAAPSRVRLLECQNGRLVHTNHFLDPDLLSVVEPPSEKRPYSIHRLDRMRALLATKEPISVVDIEGYLRDHAGHPYSVCRHLDLAEPPEERYLTVTSAIMDLHERILRLSDGPPCESAYQQVALSK